jgi:hypothetical protein
MLNARVEVSLQLELHPAGGSSPTKGDAVCHFDAAVLERPLPLRMYTGRARAASVGVRASLADHLAEASSRVAPSLAIAASQHVEPLVPARLAECSGHTASSPTGREDAVGSAALEAGRAAAPGVLEVPFEKCCESQMPWHSQSDGDTDSTAHPVTAAEGPVEQERGLEVSVLAEKALHLHPRFAASDGSGGLLQICTASGQRSHVVAAVQSQTSGAVATWDASLTAFLSQTTSADCPTQQVALTVLNSTHGQGHQVRSRFAVCTTVY